MSLAILLRNLLLKKYPLFTGCAACAGELRHWRKMRSVLFEPSFPIDLVYTWVDGSDPALLTKKMAWLNKEATRHALPPDNAHFRDNGELRYALRSWEKYAPWVRRVFIVTDKQVPAWLSPNHPKARIVDHRECVPTEFLPTFSSRVIEAHLHRIPDLGEHFIYCNDDFFLISACVPSDFFTANGLPYIFTDWRTYRRNGYYAKHKTPHAASYHNTRSYIEKHAGRTAPELITAHMPYPMRKSNMEKAYAFYKDAVMAFARDKFRSMRGLVFPCHAVPMLDYVAKRAVPRDVPFLYINAKRFDRNTYYKIMLKEQNMNTLPPFLCINDVGDVGILHTWRQDMLKFLQAFYPEQSSFER